VIAPRNALVHAAAIGVLVTIAGTIWAVVLLPNFVNILWEFKDSLPLPTRVLLAFAAFPQIWPTGILAVGTGASLAAFMVLRNRWR
jgi:type II secretory pathway component PulF